MTEKLHIPQHFTPVCSVETLIELIKQYSIKGTSTNNYQLPVTFGGPITSSHLYSATNNNNLFLLLKKGLYYKAFYYLNNLEAEAIQWPVLPVVLEILYRGKDNYPSSTITFWETQGFKKHLARDFMTATLQAPPEKPVADTNIKIVKASSESEAIFALDCMKTALDPFTGDQKTIKELSSAMADKNLYVAYYGSLPAGFFRQEIRNEITYLGHLVVDDAFRGKGIAQQLVYRFLADSFKGTPSRYQLWVIKNNAGALNLYKKFGFLYAGKSTQSMLKIVSDKQNGKTSRNT